MTMAMSGFYPGEEGVVTAFMVGVRPVVFIEQDEVIEHQRVAALLAGLKAEYVIYPDDAAAPSSHFREFDLSKRPGQTTEPYRSNGPDGERGPPDCHRSAQGLHTWRSQ